MSWRYSEDDLGALQWAEGLSDEVQNDLVAALDESPRSLDVGEIASSLTVHGATDLGQLERLLRVVVSADWQRRAASLTEDAAVESLVERLAEVGDYDVGSGLQSFLTRLASTGTVRLLGKTNDVGSEHANAFLEARILSDVRPIFADGEDLVVEGALLSQSLRITYVKDRFVVEDVTVTLDEASLSKLKTQIERAEAKAAAVRTLLETVGLPLRAGERVNDGD